MYLDLHMGGDLDVRSCPPTPCGHANIDSIYRLLSAGLTDGGTAGLIWGFVGVSLGFSLVYASIAEMASM